MAKLSNQGLRGFFSLRLLVACATAVPLCFIAYIVLLVFAVPPLLNSGSAIPTYAGFYIQYLGRSGKVSNLRCFTNGLSVDGYGYYCRFKMNSSNIRQFARNLRLESGKLVASNLRVESGTLVADYECDQSFYNIDSPLDISSYPERGWWKPLELEEGGQVQCYSKVSNYVIEVVYSPVSQIAYIRHSDY